MTTTAPAVTGDFKQLWNTFRRDNPKVRIRDAAEQLGVSEAELLATACGEGAIRLQAEWPQFIQRLESLGPVMALTRNAHAVHEKHGVFRNVHLHGQMGLVLDEGIDLRLFMNHWHLGFAVKQEGRKTTLRLSSGRSLRGFQFFDRHGTAVHKVYLTAESDHTAYQQLIDEFASEDQSPVQCVCPTIPSVPDKADDAIDVAGLEAAWNALEDTHDFHRILAEFHVGRVQALRLVNDSLACRVNSSSLNEVLHIAARDQIAIMVFVASPGVVQIHSGLIHNVKLTGPWLNVLDDDFNLHVREDRLDSAWVVHKPTRDGAVFSLELYDSKGETIALLFARRKQGQATVNAWNTALAALTRVWSI